MRFLVIAWSFAALGLSSCESAQASSVPEFGTPGVITGVLSPTNYRSWKLSLAPNEFKLVLIEGAGGAVDTSPGWWKDAAVYHVWVRSFQDSDGDGVGDLPGLTSRLDYLTNLGFGAVWTQPIFRSPSTHGYDTTDYYSINSSYGGDSAYDDYVREAHSRGVKVVLDLVINHTSSQHPWFKASSAGTGYQDWYLWQTAAPAGWIKPWGQAGQVWYYSSGRNAWYYGAFSQGMPDLNLVNPAVQAEVMKIASNYLARGADGYRLDAARYLIETGPDGGQRDTPQTLAFWRAFRTAVKAASAEGMNIGEVWTEESIVSRYYDQGRGLDQCFDFDLQSALIGAISQGKAQILQDAINSRSAPNPFFAVFLDNHDTPQGENRLMDSLGNNFRLARNAAAFALTLPGTPYIYYGTEIGMKKGPQTGDVAKRTPMQWNAGSGAGFTTGTPWSTLGDKSDPYNVAAQSANPQSLLAYYRSLLEIRKKYEGLRRGDFHWVNSGQASVLAYIRPGSNDTVLFVANLSKYDIETTLDFSGTGVASNQTLTMTELLSGASNTRR